MADKYLKLVGGVPTATEANVTSAGVGDAGKMVALDGAGKLDNSLMPSGVGAETKILEATEALTAGDFLNIYNVAGTAKCRKADATTSGKEANGFVLAGVSSGANATVYVAGINNQVSGMTPGKIFLSTTAGAGTSTSPSGAGNISQEIGTALSATEVAFQPKTAFQL